MANGLGGNKMMLPRVALTAMADEIDLRDLAAAAAALQTQVTRDFAPAWGTTGIVTAVPIEAIPYGYVPVIVRSGVLDDTACGFHHVRHDETPYVIIPAGPTWSLAASHEVLRIFADPTNSARAHAASPLPGQGTVEYLADVCAPCQDISAAYMIDGVVVSDFALPAFYGRHGQHGRGYSFTGALVHPFEPAPGGAMTWFADDRLVYQARASQTGVSIHGGFSPASRGRMLLREFVDTLLPDRLANLSHAARPAWMEEEVNKLRRARLSNMMRFQDEIAWRFGLVTAPQRPAVAEPLEPEPWLDYIVRSGHQRTNSVEATTERTAS